MKSFITRLRDVTKKTLLTLDYIFWLIFDFSKFKKIKKEEIKKVLIIHLGAIGELVATTSLISALKKGLKSDVTFMLNPGKEEIYKNNPNIDKIIFPERNFLKQIQELKEEKPDLVIILYPGSFKWGLKCFLAGIRYRIGCFAGVKGFPIFLYTRRTFPFSNQNAVYKTLDMIAQINIKNTNPRVEAYLSEKEKREIKIKLKKLKIKNYAIIHPSFSSSMGNQYPSRLWPLKRYAEIADYLSSKYKLDVFITGNPNEKKISEEIKANCKNKGKVFITNDIFNLREIMAVISNAQVMVSCGTGVVHLAAAFNTPLVVFEGKGDPIEWIPFYEKKEKLRFLFHPEVCTQCDRESCRRKDTQCMAAITTTEVKKALDSLLK